MIDWYSLVQLLKRPGKVQIDTQTKRETVKIRLTLEKDTGKEVAKFRNKPTPEQKEHERNQPGIQRFRQFFNFANELVSFTPQDLKTMNRNANGGYGPGLTILGFKPRDVIPFHHKISKTFLIFPNDTEVQGSYDAFMHLHASMLRKSVLALGEALHRESSQSRLVAVYPFQDADRLPPGMYVQYLPFEDDMRALLPDAASIEFHSRQQNTIATKRLDNEIPDPHGPDGIDGNKEAGVIPEEPNNVVSNDNLFSDFGKHQDVTCNIASEDLVQAAMNLIRRQTTSEIEIGVDFENAALTEFYAYLMSVAFDTTKEESEYDTILNKDAVLDIAGKQIDDFRSWLPIDVERPKASTSRKRIRTIVPDDSGVDWIELYERGEIVECKMDLLKKYLRSVGLATSGRKSDLVDRVTESLEQKYSKENGNDMKKEQDSVNLKENMMAGSV